MHFNGEFCALCPPLKHLQWFTRFGGSGVDLFFVLSGFILCHSHLTRDAGLSLRAYLQFIWLRIARVYPAYVVAMLAMVTFVLAARHMGLSITEAHYSSWVLLPELFMVHMWAWQNPQFGGWNAVDWSVSAEWFAYIFIFPIANLLLTRIRAIWVYLVAAALLLAGLAIPWPGAHRDGTPGLSPAIIITLEFLAGAMLYGLRRRWNSPPVKAVNAMLILAMGTAVFLLAWPSLSGIGHRPLLVACFGLAILTLSYKEVMLSGLLSARVLVYLGEVSYSLYLTHQIVQRTLKVIGSSIRIALTGFLPSRG